MAHRLRFLSDSFTLCVDWKREMIYPITERCETTAFELNAAIQPRSESQFNSKGFLFSWCWLWEVQNYRVQTSLWSSYLLISYANSELVGSDLMNNQMRLYYPLLALGSWARVSFCSHCEASVCPSLQPTDWSRSWRLTGIIYLNWNIYCKSNILPPKTIVGSRSKFIYLLPKPLHHQFFRPERYVFADGLLKYSSSWLMWQTFSMCYQRSRGRVSKYVSDSHCSSLSSRFEN